MASLQKKGDSYYCQFMYHGRRHTFTVGDVSEEEAGNKARQVDYLLMRLKQRLLVLPEGTDIVTFVQHDGQPPDTGPTLAAAPRQAVTLGHLKDRYLTTPEVNPALRRGGLMSFFRKQCASRPA